MSNVEKAWSPVRSWVESVDNDIRPGTGDEGYGAYMTMFAEASKLERQRDQLLAAVQPFLAAYRKRDAIGDSDLYDEQPVYLSVTLGDCRKLARAVREDA